VPASESGIEDELELWMSSDVKVTLARFFRQNPGLVDTLAGLSVRLAIPPERLEPQLQDHVRLGLVRARGHGEKSFYMLDPRRRAQLEDAIVRRAEGRR
jgi:hypothetical protein